MPDFHGSPLNDLLRDALYVNVCYVATWKIWQGSDSTFRSRGGHPFLTLAEII